MRLSIVKLCLVALFKNLGLGNYIGDIRLPGPHNFDAEEKLESRPAPGWNIYWDPGNQVLTKSLNSKEILEDRFKSP